MTVRMGVDVRDEVSPELRQQAERAARLTDVLDEIGNALESSTEQRFLEQQDPAGAAWRRHRPATRRRRGAGADILRERSRLFDSLGHKVQGSKVLVGANRTYARIHQLGGKAGPGRRVEIPARPYLGVSREDQREIEAIVRDHFGGE